MWEQIKIGIYKGIVEELQNMQVVVYHKKSNKRPGFSHYDEMKVVFENGYTQRVTDAWVDVYIYEKES